MTNSRFLVLAGFLILALATADRLTAQAQRKLPATPFAYDEKAPFDLKDVATETRNSATIRTSTFVNTAGGRTGAYLVTPSAAGRHAGILYVHWYDPESADSNKTQFLPEAVDNAGRGVVSLLIDTMWSEPTWFDTRDPAKDYDSSVQQVKDLRRAMDLLLAQPTVEPGRVAYVGHDFGAMYGSVVAGIDRRAKAYVFMAGTGLFSDWFLLGSKLQGADRQAVIDKLKPLAPVRFVAEASPSSVLFQFGTTDQYVPKAKAEEFFAAASQPKSVRWYDAGHGLNQDARRDRQDWLKAQLAL
jgi:dienelactone hydrolase